MKLFKCQRCGQQLYFENRQCQRCGSTLGYLPDQAVMSALDDQGDGSFRPLAAPDHQVRFCANAREDACNWLVPVAGGNGLCQACKLNRTIPDLSDQDHQLLWQRLERAKHRQVQGLMRHGLAVISKTEDPERGLAFDFLADEPVEGQKVMTGHADGVITINIIEADHVAREQARRAMDEPYRTLLGHFRHESGHYYWDRLVRYGPSLQRYREIFGDERADYGESLERHHAEGPPADWQARFVSSYASAHPWEDFAETWAHYLHVTDTLDTAFAFHLRVEPLISPDPALSADIDFDPYRAPDFDRLIAAWLPLTYAVNSLNQSMGQPPLYPFLLAPPALDKLRFVHELVRAGH
jgi:hypothetical protein